MTIDILLEALTALEKEFHPDYKRRVIKDSIRELQMLKLSVPDWHNGTWNGSIHVVHMSTAIDIQNALLYDTFGKIARSNDKLAVSFDEYMAAAQKTYGLEHTTTLFMHSGYEVLNDLWHDNEANGCHDADGSYSV